MMLQPVSQESIEKYLTSLPDGYGIVEAQLERWLRAHEAHRQWAELAVKCVEFMEGKQWTDRERKILLQEGRPCLVKNKINPLVRMIMGFQRQNRYDIKFMPGNDGTGAQEIAELLQATAKQVEEMNQSNWNDAQVFQDGIITGRGFWDERLSFDKNDLGEIMESVKDPFSIYIDPEADTYSPSKWGFYFENRWMSAVDIYMMYGKQALSNIDDIAQNFPVTGGGWYDSGFGEETPERWFGLNYFYDDDYNSAVNLYSSPFDHVNRHRKLVRVLDCQHKEMRHTDFFVDLETGEKKIIPADTPRWKIQRILQYVEMKNLPITIKDGYNKVVRWTVTAADRVLYDKWSPYDDYTLVGYFPYFRRGKTRGMVEDLLDPQTEINKRSSAFLHIVMSTANSGWIFEKGTLDQEMKRALEEEGARPGIHLEFDSKGGTKQPPRKIEPSAAPMAMKRLEDDSAADLKEISGLNDSFTGELDRVQSGRAIQARQRQAALGAEVYFDNFSRSKELKGLRWLYLIQSFYTEPRLIRIRAGIRNGDVDYINAVNAAGEIVNNVGIGRYMVEVEEAPVSSTFLQGQFQEAMELLEKGVPIPPDMLIDMSSLPQKDVLKQRLDEERIIRETQSRFENMGMHLQMGIPPGQPVPPIVTDGGPNVVNMSEMQQPPLQPMPMTQMPPMQQQQPMPPRPAPAAPGSQIIRPQGPMPMVDDFDPSLMRL